MSGLVRSAVSRKLSSLKVEPSNNGCMPLINNSRRERKRVSRWNKPSVPPADAPTSPRSSRTRKVSLRLSERRERPTGPVAWTEYGSSEVASTHTVGCPTGSPDIVRNACSNSQCEWVALRANQTIHFTTQQLVVRSFTLDEPIGRPVFYHSTGFQHDDTVEISKCRQAVGDRYYRAPLHQTSNRLTNGFLRGTVKRCSRLVQQQDW